MCCGNCSVGENFLAKFEGYPAIIGIINMKLELSLKAINTPSIVHYKAEARVRFVVEIAQLGITF